MAIEIISHRERIETVSYALFFERKQSHGGGYAYECDERGNLLADENATKEQREKEAQACRDSGEYLAPRIQTFRNSYVNPAVGRCTCGDTVELADGLENYCNSCQACYNLFGQRVYPELAEERFEDDY